MLSLLRPFLVRLIAVAGFAFCASGLLMPLSAQTELFNLSARHSLIAGGTVDLFVTVEGPGTRTMLFRAAGPTLSSFGVSGVLADPRLTLRASDGTLIAENDDWGTAEGVATMSSAVGVFSFGSGSKDAALIATLGAGTYRLSGEGAPGAGGIMLVEAYAAEGTAPITYLAVGSDVGPSPTILLGGVGVRGNGSQSYLVRGLGPALGIGGLADPSITVLNSSGVVFTSNDNWSNSVELGNAASSTGVSPLAANSPDAALLTALTPGSYTVQLSGNGGSGRGLIEILSADAVPAVTAAPPALFPAKLAVPYGGVSSLTAIGTMPAGATYQWSKNGVPITGATARSLGITASSLAVEGDYTCTVTAGGVSLTSGASPVTVSGLTAPVFTVPPRSVAVRLGEPVMFSATAAGTPTPTLQWFRNGVLIPGATSASYTLPEVTSGDLAAAFTVVATSIAGSTTSAAGVVGLRGSGPVGRAFTVVGESGRILRSADGLTWTQHVLGTAHELFDVADNGTTQVVVGAGGTVVSSTDGATWTPRVLPSAGSRSMRAVVAGADRFVAVGEGGYGYVSYDGASWIDGGLPTQRNLNGVVYANGVYVAVGDFGTLFTSTDGVSWVNRSSETWENLTHVGYTGAQYWAISAEGTLVTSTDAVTWTRHAVVVPTWFRGLAGNGALFVATGTGGRLQTSVDGVTWTTRASEFSSEAWNGVSWSGPEFAGGFSPATVLSDLDFRFINSAAYYSVAAGGELVLSAPVSGGGNTYAWFKGAAELIGQTQSTLTLSNVQASQAGTYQVQVTNATGTITSPVLTVALRGQGTLGQQFVAVGAESGLLTSPDGVTWTPRGSPGAAETMRAVAASAFRAVAVGRSDRVLVSADGATWSSRPVGSSGATLRGIASGPSQFVAVGSGGAIYLSRDQGDTWLRMTSPTTTTLTGVAFNGATFVAVGEGGTVLTSPDGVTWAAQTGPTSSSFYTVGVNGASFVAVTNAGAVFTSATGGASWVAGSASAPAWARGTAVDAAGQTVVVGDNGLIATNEAGGDWVRRSSPTSSRLYDVVWTGVSAVSSSAVDEVAAGTGLSLSQVPQDLVVTTGATATFSVVASGVNPLTYQWQKDGVAIAGATSPTLVLANVQASAAGSYRVLVSSPTGTVLSPAATLTVTPPASGTAPTIAVGPAGAATTVGGAVSFSVTASGTGPFTYQWRFNGQPIAGAVSSTLSLAGVQLANAGSYTVVVGNDHGSVLSGAALLTVANASGAPVITAQPANQIVNEGGDVVFTVTATGDATLAYQWRRDGVNLAGQTGATLSLTGVTSAQAGAYSVVVSNGSGSVTSELASLSVVPAGMSAQHGVVGTGYLPGGTVTISNTLNFVGTATALGWEVLLPAGWSFVSAAGTLADSVPQSGDTSLLSFAWVNVPTSPVTFTYTLAVPGDATGDVTLAALIVVRQGGVPIQLLGKPDPLVVAPASSRHAADTNGDGKFSLLELTRVIQLYNTRNGTTRTGAYAVATTATEDGFAPDSVRDPATAVTLARSHTADTDGDARISLSELTRVIQLYNTRTGTVRTGAYRQVGTGETATVDGFMPNP